MAELPKRPKIDRSKYIFENKEGETLYKHYGEICGFTFKLRKLKNCTIYLLDCCSGVYIKYNIK